MAKKKENTISKDILIERIAKTISDESKLVKKIMREIKEARQKPRIRLNINEKQLQVHLSEAVKKWEKAQIPLLINKFLTEIKTS